MSHTDKTDPFWVKLLHHDLDSMEVHDHTLGPCDLPEQPTELEHFNPYGRRCYWNFAYTGTQVCCCVLCHGDSWGDGSVKKSRRRERARAKQQLRRQIAAEVADGLLGDDDDDGMPDVCDVDDPVKRISVRQVPEDSSGW